MREMQQWSSSNVYVQGLDGGLANQPSKRRRIGASVSTSTTCEHFNNNNVNTRHQSYTQISITQNTCTFQNGQATLSEPKTLKREWQTPTYEAAAESHTRPKDQNVFSLLDVKMSEFELIADNENYTDDKTLTLTSPVSDPYGPRETGPDQPQFSEHKSKEIDLGEEIVCYGMLDQVQTQQTCLDFETLDPVPAQWNGQTQLQDVLDGSNMIDLLPHTFQLLTTLAEYARACFQFWIRREQQKKGDVSARRSLSGINSDKQHFLSIIVYGPLNMAGVVGEWMSTARLFLQMPIDCALNVKYKNPHCLSFHDDPASMTQELSMVTDSPDARNELNDCDNFIGLYTEESYDEAEQPWKIRTRLHGHQKVALGFLLEREKGWDFDSPKSGIWKRKSNSFGVLKYENCLSGHVQKNPPIDFRGGILADEMGLGKTCTILSLVAMDDNNKQGAMPDCGNRRASKLGTLVVVPFALLQVWEKQICEHFRPDSVRWKVFHGSGRHSSIDDLESFDIVITTYNTVTTERRTCSRKSVEPSRLFSGCWHRIVLDEAHVVRNKETVISRAVCALRSDRRWCVTGTPIQNRLSDLFGLLRFLGIEPYNRFKEFENDILRPWRSHNDKVALMRLLHLVKSISIRRPRSVVALPSKEEIIVPVCFASHERSTYESAREGAINALDAAFETTVGRTSTYMNALQRINDLRYICNHGVRPFRDRLRSVSRLAQAGSKSNASIDDFDTLMDVNGYNCTQCGTDIQEELEEALWSLRLPGDCTMVESSSSRLCKLCLKQEASQDTPSMVSPASFDAESMSLAFTNDSIPTSSKIQALVYQLQQLPPSEKAVIFSYWTSTLAAVAKVLVNSGINHIQYDGTLSRVQRVAALHDFAISSSTKVILVSITCGGQGLDLTAANNAFLLEPQWNPMLEEQAMSRVHRLGQTKPVKLVRFIVQGTWEEKIRALQERKRNLVDLIIERRNLKEGDEGSKQLHFLRELIA